MDQSLRLQALSARRGIHICSRVLLNPGDPNPLPQRSRTLDREDYFNMDVTVRYFCFPRSRNPVLQWSIL
jgi:hypothetical protein